MPTPTPIPQVQTLIEAGLQQNYALLVGAVWSVLLLFLFSSLAGDRVKNQQAFLIILLASFPVLLVSVGWWALSIYFFYLLYLVVVALRSVGG